MSDHIRLPLKYHWQVIRATWGKAATTNVITSSSYATSIIPAAYCDMQVQTPFQLYNTFIAYICIALEVTLAHQP